MIKIKTKIKTKIKNLDITNPQRTPSTPEYMVSSNRNRSEVKIILSFLILFLFILIQIILILIQIILILIQIIQHPNRRA